MAVWSIVWIRRGKWHAVDGVVAAVVALLLLLRVVNGWLLVVLLLLHIETVHTRKQNAMSDQLGSGDNLAYRK